MPTPSAPAALDEFAAEPPRPPVSTRRAVGAELPRSVYRLIVTCYVWMLACAGFFFIEAGSSTLDILFSVAIFAMMLGIPAVIRHVSLRRQREPSADLYDFLHGRLETWSGMLSGREALVQIMIIPVALAVLGTILSVIYFEYFEIAIQGIS